MLLLVCFAIHGMAGPPMGKPKRVSQNASRATTDGQLRTLDAKIKKSPANFSGTSIQAAFRKFYVRPKGEFEATSQYEARIKQLPWGIYAFVVPTRFTDIAYDADGEMLSVVPMAVSPAIGFDRSSDAGIELARENERTRKYAASNALGASIVVEEYAYSSFSLITDVDSLPVLTYAIPRSRAAALKDQVRVLAVVGLDENSFIGPSHEVLKDSTGFRHTKPTFDDPTEVTISDHSLRAQVLELWLFNRSTGEVLGRFDTTGEQRDGGS